VRKIIALIPILAVLLFSFVVVFQPVVASAPISPQLQNSPALTFVNEEYANGTIVPSNSPLQVWYNWVNVSGTQIINYAMYTTPEWNYSVPIANIIGQHLRVADGSEVFVASAIDGMEVYRDMNGDGIPQANFTSGDSEILYFMYSNMSKTYSMTPIQKVLENNVTHYQWGFTYGKVGAYLQNATVHVGVDVRMILDHLTLSYDFSVNGNVSNLKTSFDIGKAENIEVFDPVAKEYVNSSDFSLNGLSLSLLYATATYASKPYSTSVNGQPYNSSTAESPAVDAETAQIAVNDTRAYDFIFGGNYTLSRGENNETYPANIETYEAKAEAAAISSLPIKIFGPVVRGISFFTDELNLADLFGGSWPSINTNYDASSLVYRICFPVWDGMQIMHDPVYVGYVASTSTIPEFQPAVALPLFIGASLVVLVAAKIRKRNCAK